MYALRIGPDTYVREYRYCTLAHFGRDTSLNKDPDVNGLYWVWIDRTAFWTPDEHRAFMTDYTNYYYKAKVRTVRKRYAPST